MGNKGSQGLQNPEGPIVDSMVATYGRESVTFSSNMVQRLCFSS